MVEVILANQCLQGKVGLQGRTRRAYSNYFRFFQYLFDFSQHFVMADHMVVKNRLFDAIRRVYKFVAKPSTITNEIPVHISMITIRNRPKRPVAFTCNDVATQTTMLTN